MSIVADVAVLGRVGLLSRRAIGGRMKFCILDAVGSSIAIDMVARFALVFVCDGAGER